LNGRPAIGFATGTSLDTGTTAVLQAALRSASGTLFQVFSIAPGFFAGGLFFEGNAGAEVLYCPAGDNIAGAANLVVSATPPGNAVAGTTTSTAGGVGAVGVTMASGAWSFRVNGVAQATLVLAGINSGAWFAAFTGGGCDRILVSQTYPGTLTLGEVVLYDRALTAAQILTVEAYLRGKWGLP
jgi:hypothetical protein